MATVLSAPLGGQLHVPYIKVSPSLVELPSTDGLIDAGHIRNSRTVKSDVSLDSARYRPDPRGDPVEHNRRNPLLLLLVLDRWISFFQGRVHVPDVWGVIPDLLHDDRVVGRVHVCHSRSGRINVFVFVLVRFDIVSNLHLYGG